MLKERTERSAFHLVDSSPWPLVVSTAVLILTSGSVIYMHGYGSVKLLGLGLIFLLLGMYYWLRDVIREGTYEGQHTSVVQRGLRLGMILFILSEVMFFFGFFFAYFWSALGATVEVGSVWPSIGIIPLNAWEIPALNTGILLASGATITWAHHALIIGDRGVVLDALLATISLAIIFTCLQVYEYMSGSFTISDSAYGSTFYMLTGFHGFHVIIGTLMIIVTALRVWKYELTKQHHFGFEGSAYYWHFVDVVWLYLFVILYVWGA